MRYICNYSVQQQERSQALRTKNLGHKFVKYWEKKWESLKRVTG